MSSKAVDHLKTIDVSRIYKTKTMKRNIINSEYHQPTTTREINLPEPSPKKAKPSTTIESNIVEPTTETAINLSCGELSPDQKKEVAKLKKVIEKASKSINIQPILQIISTATCTQQIDFILKDLSIDKLNDGLLFHIIQGLFSKNGGLNTSNNSIDTNDQCSSIIRQIILPKLLNMKQKASRHLFSCIQQICCNQKFSNLIIDILVLNILTEKTLSVDQIEIITRMLDKVFDLDSKAYLLKLMIENITGKIIYWNEDTTINILNRVMETKNLTSKIDVNLLEMLLHEFEEIIPQYSKSLKFALLFSNYLTLLGQTQIIKTHNPSIKDIISQLDNKMKDNIEKKFENLQQK